MSDNKLRDLERRWKRTGAVEDEAAYLLERVRVGDLSQERLELAAHCGHEGAGSALPWVPPLDLTTWVSGLLARSREAYVRFAKENLTETLSQQPLFASDPRLLGTVEAVSAWLSCRCEAHAQSVADAQSVAYYADGPPEAVKDAVYLAEAIVSSAAPTLPQRMFTSARERASSEIILRCLRSMGS